MTRKCQWCGKPLPQGDRFCCTLCAQMHAWQKQMNGLAILDAFYKKEKGT